MGVEQLEHFLGRRLLPVLLVPAEDRDLALTHLHLEFVPLPAFCRTQLDVDVGVPEAVISTGAKKKKRDDEHRLSSRHWPSMFSSVAHSREVGWEVNAR